MKGHSNIYYASLRRCNTAALNSYKIKCLYIISAVLIFCGRTCAFSQSNLPGKSVGIQEHGQHTPKIRIGNPGVQNDGWLNPEPKLTQKEINMLTSSSGRNGLAILVRGDTARKEIALTFDDGPHPQFTLRLLALLRQLDVRATFFVVGEKVDQAPYILPMIIKDGHELGNHTYHHLNLTKISNELIQSEIQQCNNAIHRACGVNAQYFRPPGGRHDAVIITMAEALKMVTVLWTDDPADYKMPGEQILEDRLLHHISNGAVCLLHDGIEQTLDILPDLIMHLRREGYRFVTLSELRQHLKAAPSGH